MINTFIHSCSSLLKPYPIPNQNGQSLYQFSDQNAAKFLAFGAAHTCMVYIREYPPPSTQPLHVTDRRAQLGSVTEIAPKSPFLCVNRSSIRYGFRASACAKATQYIMVWRPIQLVTLHFRDRRDTAQPCNITEITPESPFLCVNSSTIRYGFRAGACAKATRYGVKTYPTCDSPR